MQTLGDVYVVEEEQAGVPGLLGTKVRVEKVSGMSPFLSHNVITPVGIACSDAKFMNLFKNVKPRVISVKEGVLKCTLGIVARKV